MSRRMSGSMDTVVTRYTDAKALQLLAFYGLPHHLRDLSGFVLLFLAITWWT